jgi:group I intron endonuclease
MSQLGVVYKITNPEGAVYVGSTKDFKQRIAHYRVLACKGQKRLYESLKKYGYDKHALEIVCSVPYYELKKKERDIGILFNALDLKIGLNDILPGYGNIKQLRSEKYKEGHRERSDSQIGKSLTLDTKAKMSKNSNRHSPSNETKAKAKAKLARPIFQFSMDGIFICEFESTADASRATGISRKNITYNLNNKHSLSAGGYVWKFKDGIIKGKNHRKVIQMDLNGTIMKTHDSICEAARSVNVDHTSIRYVAQGKGQTAGGYKWKYFNEERSGLCLH